MKICLLPNKGTNSVEDLTTMVDRFRYIITRASKYDEWGANAIIGPSLQLACFPFTVIQNPPTKNTPWQNKTITGRSMLEVRWDEGFNKLHIILPLRWILPFSLFHCWYNVGEWCQHINGFPQTIINLNFNNSQYQLPILKQVFLSLNMNLDVSLPWKIYVTCLFLYNYM